MATLAQGEPRTIVVNPSGPPSNTLSFVLPPGVTISLESVLAAIDASGAGDTTATLTIADSSKAVIARKAQGRAVTGGAVGSATWALRLDDESGGGGVDPNAVRFNDPNNELPTRYLAIPVNDRAPSGVGFDVVSSKGIRLRDTDDGPPFGGLIEAVIDNSNTLLALTHDTANLIGYFHLRLTSDSGDIVMVAAGGDVKIRSSLAGKAVRIITHAGTDVIEALDEKLGFFGAAPAARPAHPVTLADVIAALTALGLTA